jgi:hypothetical protein
LVPAPQQFQLDAPIPVTALWETEGTDANDEAEPVEEAGSNLPFEALPIAPAKPALSQRSIFL